MSRQEVPLREITTEEIWAEVQRLRNELATHNHLTSGVQQLTGQVSGILESPNFLTGSTGWQLLPNGNVEFGSGTFRGTIKATAGYFGDETNGVSIESTGLELTGTGFIRTASSGARIEIASNVMNIYDVNGLVGKIDGSATQAVFTASIDSSSDSRGLLIISNNTAGTVVAAQIDVKGNQTALSITNTGNNLAVTNLVEIIANSTHASRSVLLPALRITNWANGSGLYIASATAATGPSIFTTHGSSGSVIGWQLDFTHNSNNGNALFINKTGTGTGYALQIVQGGVKETNFKRIADLAGVSLYISDGTTPDGNLTGVVGDICFNGAGGLSYYCDTAGKNWTAM